MRTAFALSIAIVLCASRCAGQWLVFDASALQQNLAHYAAFVEQIGNQVEQINNQVQQIHQMEDRLRRLGDMAEVRAMVGFPELRVDLNLEGKIKAWGESVLKVDGHGIFGDTRGGIYVDVEARFPDFEGVARERLAKLYKPVHDIINKIDNFKDVQIDIYVRRKALKRAIARTSEALRVATTQAEEMKLEATLSAQFGQLASLDAEVELSASEIHVKQAEAAAMRIAMAEAEAEARATLGRQEARKIGMTYKPVYDSILLYVKEPTSAP